MERSVLVLILAGLATQAEPTVTVCMDNFPDTVIVVATAQGIAARMFTTIGVPIEWHGYKSCPRGRMETIRIRLTTNTPEKYLPGAMAYAQPFDGTHVRVFFDRVQRMVGPEKERVSSLLAHVLVHEITHILQGTNAHSPSGVMKARWGPDEYRQMVTSPLAFAEEDVTRIHSAFASRASAAQPTSGTGR